ncbi:ABC transporter permease [Pseudonocardia nigra]|uniref:ABC transporter permease n=1 Tax=Pseudonocardia nigra TaxID=1921578 RepID=UPI001C5CE521|nr:ABC transporter permease [Pseudonocardia nigra]
MSGPGEALADAGATDQTQPREPRIGLSRLIRDGVAAWLVVAVIVLGLSVVEGGGFWSAPHLATVLTATVVLGLVALSQHLVVLSGGIDLSVGSTATLSALLTAVLIDGYPIRTVPVVLAVLGVGLLVGVVHGLLVARVALPPFIVTLSTFYVLQGIALQISSTPAGQVSSDLSALALNRIGPLPYSLAVLALAVAAAAFLLYRTVWGRHVFAVGGDPAAARFGGIRINRVLVGVYAAAGVLAAMAGILLAARATIGSPTAGQGLELSAITVVVIGGTSLLGGKGKLIGTLGGVMLLALVSSSITLLQLPSTITDLVRGAVIIAAAAVFVSRARR